MGKGGRSGEEGHLASEDVIPKWWSVECVAGWRNGRWILFMFDSFSSGPGEYQMFAIIWREI